MKLSLGMRRTLVAVAVGSLILGATIVAGRRPLRGVQRRRREARAGGV